MNNTKLAWVEIDIKEVMDYFIKGFRVKEGEVISHEWFHDPRKGKVIFKLVVEDQPTPPPLGRG